MINDFQKLSLKKFKIKSILPDATILCLGKRRSGKCLMKGETVLMYDGTIKMVEDIKKGELVMGDDSTPRTVLETHSGTDELYRITNKHGESYTVNSHHILSLIYTGKKYLRDRTEKESYQVIWFDNKKCKMNYKTFSYKHKDKKQKEKIYDEANNFFINLIDDRKIDIPLKEYIQLKKKYQQNLLGYQVPINFSKKEIPIDPYILGYWLGDGNEK